MKAEAHAKAIAAFVAVIGAVLVASGACMALGLGAPSALTAAPFVAAIAATAVWWLPNRTHGFNVNEIAAALVNAGLEAARKGERQ